MPYTHAQLTIPSGQPLSNEVLLGSADSDRALLLGTPVGLVESVVVEVSFDSSDVWYPLMSDGAVITITGAGEAHPLTDVPAKAIRLACAPNAGADRVFELGGGWK